MDPRRIHESITNKNTTIETDYNLSKDDILDAKKVEPYYKMFGIFNMNDKKMITLALAAARTISRKGGFINRAELNELLSYMQKKTRVIE